MSEQPVTRALKRILTAITVILGVIGLKTDALGQG